VIDFAQRQFLTANVKAWGRKDLSKYPDGPFIMTSSNRRSLGLNGNEFGMLR
jgi:hypothetical protein